MAPLRRALGPIAALWLACQVGVLAAAPVLLQAGAAEGALECTCAHGDHAVCPMHHESAPGSKVCLIRGADEGDAAVLASVFSLAGVLTAPTQARVSASAHSVVHVFATTPPRPSVPPDPPPPRA